MIGRISSQQLVGSAQRHLQDSTARLARLQDQASSQRLLTKPSDDPSATGDALRVRAQLGANEQYASNIDDATGWLSTADSALGDATDVLRRVRDLTLQAANDPSASPAVRESLAAEIEQLAGQLLASANTRYLGRNVFAGTSGEEAAFRADFSFTGASGAAVTRRIGDGASVQVDADGQATFGEGATSAFALIGSIAADVRSGASVTGRIAEIDQRFDAVQAQRSAIGARLTRVEHADTASIDRGIALETQRSKLEDVDLAKVLIDLETQKVAHQATLAVTAQSVPQSLLDFLR
jgi:flagellar hook-associated protein 3 FlgL